MNPNQTLLESRNQSASDVTPAPLTGPSSVVSYEFQNIQPPSMLYVNVDDQIIISAGTSQTAEVVTVNVRLLLPTGRIEDMQFQIRPANTRTVLKQSFGLAEGYLLSMSASAAVATTRGQTFVRVSLQRSASGAGNPAYCLMADYVNTQSVPGYPNGRILSPTEGPGYLLMYAPGNPGAGNDFNIPVPTNARWRIQGLNANFITSAAVQNRTPKIVVYSSVGTAWEGGTLAPVVASSNVFFNVGALPPWTAGDPTQLYAPIPPNLFLAQNASQAMGLKSLTGLLQAGDSWGSIGLLVEEWLDNV